jgi:hypothetical protein
MRCRFCEELTVVKLSQIHHYNFKNQIWHHKIYRHQPSEEALVASANNGCDICKLFLRCLQKRYPRLSAEIDTISDSDPIMRPDYGSVKKQDIFVRIIHTEGIVGRWCNQLKVCSGLGDFEVGLDLFISRGTAAFFVCRNRARTYPYNP